MRLPGIIKRQGLPDLFFGKVISDEQLSIIISDTRDTAYCIGYDIVSYKHNLWEILELWQTVMEKEPWTPEWVKRIKKINNS